MIHWFANRKIFKVTDIQVESEHGSEHLEPNSFASQRLPVTLISRNPRQIWSYCSTQYIGGVYCDGN
jgi:hypothetical protein